MASVKTVGIPISHMNLQYIAAYSEITECLGVPNLHRPSAHNNPTAQSTLENRNGFWRIELLR